LTLDLLWLVRGYSGGGGFHGDKYCVQTVMHNKKEMYWNGSALYRMTVGSEQFSPSVLTRRREIE
jgi:hypothetical protein